MTSPRVICLAALVVRLVYITVAHSYRFRPILDHFEFGWEAGRVGRSLALGRGFADPFVPSGTGPTAWLPPLYPLIIGAVFRVFGIYTRLSGWVLLAINSVFAAATVPAIYEIAQRCFGTGGNWERGRRIAVWSAWIWALYPATMQYSVRWIWEMSLTTMLLAWALVVAFRLRDAGGAGLRLWATFGALWAGIAMSNATPLLLLPVCGVWILWPALDRRKAVVVATIAAVVFAVCLAPWTWRNWAVFHVLVPVRGNLGAELYVGNGPESNGFPWGITVFSAPDLALYKRMGEAAFVRERGEMARAWIAAHPGRFAELSLKRAYFYWVNVPRGEEKNWLQELLRESTFTVLSVTGWLGLILALRRKIPGGGLFAAAFVLIPVTYYFVTVGARFRHPLEPLLVILTVYLFSSAEKSFGVLGWRRGMRSGPGMMQESILHREHGEQGEHGGKIVLCVKFCA